MSPITPAEESIRTYSDTVGLDLQLGSITVDVDPARRGVFGVPRDNYDPETRTFPVEFVETDDRGITGDSLDVLDHVLSRVGLDRRGPWTIEHRAVDYWVCPVVPTPIRIRHTDPRYHWESIPVCVQRGACRHTSLVESPRVPELRVRGVSRTVRSVGNLNGRRRLTQPQPIASAAS